MKVLYKQILKIIKELEIPVDLHEIESDLRRLDEYELKLIMFKYQAIKNRIDALEVEAKKHNSKRYSEIQADYTKQLKEKTKKRINKMEEIREELDKKLDKEDGVARDDFKKALTKIDSALNALNTIYKKFYSSLAS